MADTTFPMKVRRAREHFGTFHEALKWWIETEPYRITQEVDAEADIEKLVVVADEQPPERLSLMLGDAIQNLRSALDYLIGDLARSNAGGHLMPRVESDLMFPITTSRRRFKDAVFRQARLGCVAARPAAVIQKLQPYRRGQDIDTHPLWILHELSNIDKHRRIPLLWSVVQSVTYNSVRFHNVQSLEIGGGGPFKDKAVLLAFSPASAKVEVDLGAVVVQVVLGEGLPGTGQPPVDVFNTVIGWVADNAVNPLGTYL